MSARVRIHLPALVALALACTPLQASASGDWEWMVAPYLWGASFNTDLDVDSPPVSTGSDRSFSDLVDKFDGVFEIHAEGQNEQWGVLGDYTYLGLADAHSGEVFDTETDLDVKLFELAGVWSPGEGRFQGLDVFGGLRRVDLDFTVGFDPVNPAFADTSFRRGRSFDDFMLGLRYTWPLSERWTLTLRGDGSWGDTAGTWNGSAVFGLRTEHGNWLFGYRALNGKFEDDNSKIRVSMSGPEVGYAFRF